MIKLSDKDNTFFNWIAFLNQSLGLIESLYSIILEKVSSALVG
jgi:hypothetical protein